MPTGHKISGTSIDVNNNRVTNGLSNATHQPADHALSVDPSTNGCFAGGQSKDAKNPPANFEVIDLDEYDTPLTAASPFASTRLVGSAQNLHHKVLSAHHSTPSDAKVSAASQSKVPKLFDSRPRPLLRHRTDMDINTSSKGTCCRFAVAIFRVLRVLRTIRIQESLRRFFLRHA